MTLSGLTTFHVSCWCHPESEERLIGRSTVFIVDSPTQRELWKAWGLDPRKCVVIPHGVPSRNATPISNTSLFDIRDRYMIADDEKLVFYIGDISRLDGIDILIEDHKGKVSSVITLFLNSIINKERPIIYGNGSQRRDFIYIDDIITAILNSTENNIQGIINVGSGDAWSFNEVLDMLNDMLNKSVKALYVDKPANYLETTLADTAKMKKILKVNPLSLEEGLRRYLSVKGLIN